MSSRFNYLLELKDDVQKSVQSVRASKVWDIVQDLLNTTRKKKLFRYRFDGG
jgi:hypothetical protein